MALSYEQWLQQVYPTTQYAASQDQFSAQKAQEMYGQYVNAQQGVAPMWVLEDIGGAQQLRDVATGLPTQIMSTPNDPGDYARYEAFQQQALDQNAYSGADFNNPYSAFWQNRYSADTPWQRVVSENQNLHTLENLYKSGYFDRFSNYDAAGRDQMGQMIVSMQDYADKSSNTNDMWAASVLAAPLLWYAGGAANAAAGGGVAGGAAAGATTGALAGGGQAAIQGENVGEGALTGGLIGGVTGAAGGYLAGSDPNSTGISTSGLSQDVNANAGEEFTGGFTGTATGSPGFTGTVTGEPGVLTAGAPGTSLAPDFFGSEALVPGTAAAATGATGGWSGAATTAATAGAPLAADAVSSSSGSPEASSFGAPSGGSSGGGSGGSGSPSGGGSGASSWLNAGSWMSSIFGDNELDWLKLAGRALPGLLGAFASGSQAEDFEDLANQYSNMGAPYRTRLEQLYTNPQTFLNSPEVTEPIRQGTDMLARSLSVKGNPAGSGNALQEIQNYASTQLFNRLGAEKDRLAGFGGLTQYSAAAPQAAQNAVGAQRGVYDALGGMAADVFNPPKRYRLEDLLRGFNG